MGRRIDDDRRRLDGEERPVESPDREVLDRANRPRTVPERGGRAHQPALRSLSGLGPAVAGPCYPRASSGKGDRPD